MNQPTRASIMRPLLRDTAAAIAVPTALYAFVGNPLPLRLPSTDTLVVWWNTLQASPGEAVHPVITGLVYLLWIAWAWHALWTATALAWVTLRLPALVLPGALQRLTPAAAVQALALGSMLTTQTAHAAAAMASTASTVHVQTAPGRAQRADSLLRQDEPGTATTYTVKPGDTLWSIAQQQLGDGRDWPRIYTENEHTPQATGGNLHDPGTIEPGWTLTIPTTTARTATGAETGSAAPNAETANAAPVPGPLPPPATRTPAARDAGPTTTPAPHPAHGAHVAPGTPDTARNPAAPPDTATAAPTAHVAPTTADDDAPARPTRTEPEPGPGAHAAEPGRRTESPAVPHTVGLELPGGYLGISLLTVIAAACMTLARRRSNPGEASAASKIPARVRALASVARRAHAAATYGYLPDEQTPGATPPLLFTPHPATPTLGIGPEPAHEAEYEPERFKLLSLTGPGATEAAAALMVSILATDADAPAFPGLDTAAHGGTALRVITDLALAHELLELDASDAAANPEWLTVTPTPDAAALAAVLPTARPGIAEHTKEHADSPKPTTCVLFTRAACDADLTQTIRALSSASAPLAVVFLGPALHAADDTPELRAVTQASVAADGRVTEARGPAAVQFTGLRLQTLSRDLASEIHRVLRNSRTPHQQTQHTTEPHSLDSTSGEDDHAAAEPARVPEQATPGQQPPRRASDEAEASAPPLLLRVLGPIEIDGPAGTIPVTGDKTAALLALLAVHPRGRTIAQIADQAWDGLDVTGTDATPIRSAIARARTLLRAACHEKPPGAELITTGPLGFRLNPRWITTDLAQLESIDRAVRHTQDPDRRAELLQQAADLWRGELAEALDDFDRDWLTTARIAYDRQAAALATRLNDTVPNP